MARLGMAPPAARRGGPAGPRSNIRRTDRVPRSSDPPPAPRQQSGARETPRRRSGVLAMCALAVSLPWAPLGSAAMPSWPAAVAAAEDPTELYRTRNFAIEHSMPDAWAAEMGAHLERPAAEFYEQASPLGARPAPESVNGAPLRWRFLVSAPESGPPGLRSTYDSRHHAVIFLLTPRSGGVPSSGAPDAPDHTRGRHASRRRGDLFIRISHEMAHQLAFDCGLQTRGVMYPVWIGEGLATNFESPDDTALFLGPNPSRQDRLARLVREGSLLPLTHLAVVTHPGELRPRRAATSTPSHGACFATWPRTEPRSSGRTCGDWRQCLQAHGAGRRCSTR